MTTHLACPTGILRQVTEADKERLAYADIYMGVHESYRRRGYGSYLVQELKRIAYEMGKTPAARCNVSNAASRQTLQKAGMLPCCRLLVGDVVN